MNKYEKAIKYFEKRKAEKAAMSFEDEAVENINTALEALRKQVPRALDDYTPVYLEGECPTCGRFYNGETYCGTCGQRVCLQLSECILRRCSECPQCDNFGDRVCENYADKVDEIRRIHEEG